MNRGITGASLVGSLEGQGGRLDEGLIYHIMQQAMQAAQTYCHSAVFLGDIMLENFIMNKDSAGAD